MASTRREASANYFVHDSYEVDTADNEDHTFCGIMFNVEVLDDLPVDHVQINSIWCRGALGDISIYTTPTGWEGKIERANEWIKLYNKKHEYSMQKFVELKLDVPLQLKPGVRRGLYVHSTRVDDDSIVYDNQRHRVTHEDNFLRILPGVAHLSPVPFGGRAPWGGRPWRVNRQFVGRIQYGTRYLLWNPEIHEQFPSRFQLCASEFLVRHATSWQGLPGGICMYVLNMIPYDWFEAEEDVNRSRRNSAGRRTQRERTSRYNLRERGQSLADRMRAFFDYSTDGEDDEDYVENGDDDDGDNDDDEDEVEVEIGRPDLIGMLQLLRRQGLQVRLDNEQGVLVLENDADETEGEEKE
jgi:hypothetical protein